MILLTFKFVNMITTVNDDLVTIASSAAQSIINNDELELNDTVMCLEQEEVDEIICLAIYGKSYLTSMYDTTSYQAFRNAMLEEGIVRATDKGAEVTQTRVFLYLIVMYGYNNDLIEDEE